MQETIHCLHAGSRLPDFKVFFNAQKTLVLTPNYCAEEILLQNICVRIVIKNTVFMHGVVHKQKVKSKVQPYSLSRSTISHVILVIAA